VTHAEACHTAFDRAGLWHWVGEGRRLEHYLRTGRWQPPLVLGPHLEVTQGVHLQGGAWRKDAPWETYG
jgi:hypothetical protein